MSAAGRGRDYTRWTLPFLGRRPIKSAPRPWTKVQYDAPPGRGTLGIRFYVLRKGQPMVQVVPTPAASRPIRRPPEADIGQEDARESSDQLIFRTPHSDLDDYRALYADPLWRRAAFHRTWPAERPGEPQEILVVGCGTSQAARYALREPDSAVTAIDSSVSGLSHMRDLQRRYALGNLELQYVALENVQELNRSFDLIICTGVLHQLPDPDRGLRALRAVLRPKGAMHLMVYGTYGRTGVSMLQEFCRMLHIKTVPEDLRDLGELLKALPSDHPIAALWSQAAELFQPQRIIDALLHPGGRAFTVPALYTWLERAGVSFGRWIEQAPYLPQCGVLANAGFSRRLTALPVPAQHAAAELLRGTMIQHRLIAYRCDHEGAGQSINFSGQQWRDYVPIRLPWTQCIRDRGPPGSVAVLVNPRHTHPDLSLPITWAQEQLLGAIDGDRALGEIVTACGTTKGAERALRFFEQLYRYDQIVFDASRMAAQGAP
jgi:SAM-dependent methyltransferase